MAHGGKDGAFTRVHMKDPYHDHKREHLVARWRVGLKVQEQGIRDTLIQTREGKWLAGNWRDDADILKRC